MAVIYCKRCTRGVHYTDVCQGGANGYPFRTKKEVRIETAKVWALALVLLALVFLSIAQIVGA